MIKFEPVKGHITRIMSQEFIFKKLPTSAFYDEKSIFGVFC